MNNKLVKEIITTTTERFGESGSIKEKVTESREKIYQNNFTEKQISEAEEVEAQKDDQSAPQEKPNQNTTVGDKEELIKQAAAKMDANNKNNNQQQAAFQPTQVPQQQNYQPMPYQPQQPIVPQYNRVGMQPPVQNPPQNGKFPWEK